MFIVIEVKQLHEEKAVVDILVKELGKEIVINEFSIMNACGEIVFADGKLIDDKLLQLQKHIMFMFSIAGRVIDAMLQQFENMPFDDITEGKLTYVKLLQLQKGVSPTLVTAGKSTETKLVHPLNIASPKYVVDGKSVVDTDVTLLSTRLFRKVELPPLYPLLF